MKAAVFFERDGVLNHARAVGRNQAPPLRVEEFLVRDEAIESLSQLKAAGYLLLATTNQPAVARGQLSRRELDRMHDMLRRALPLDEILVCPHDEDYRCNCRKPGAGLLVEASFKWHLDLDRSFVVSDKWQDAAAAYVAGCTSVLIKSQWNGSSHHDFVVPSLSDAVRKVLQFQTPCHALLRQSQVA